MSFKFIKTILFSIIFLFKIIKNKEKLDLPNESLRFLIDSKSSKTAYSKHNNEIKNEEYNLIDRIREINPLEIFKSFSSSAQKENPSFNVRCFWVDLETLRVYDLIKLKTKE
jgi:hypothetical protein